MRGPPLRDGCAHGPRRKNSHLDALLPFPCQSPFTTVTCSFSTETHTRVSLLRPIQALAAHALVVVYWSSPGPTLSDAPFNRLEPAGSAFAASCLFDIASVGGIVSPDHAWHVGQSRHVRGMP